MRSGVRRGLWLVIATILFVVVPPVCSSIVGYFERHRKEYQDDWIDITAGAMLVPVAATAVIAAIVIVLRVLSSLPDSEAASESLNDDPGTLSPHGARLTNTGRRILRRIPLIAGAFGFAAPFFSNDAPGIKADKSVFLGCTLMFTLGLVVAFILMARDSSRDNETARPE